MEVQVSVSSGKYDVVSSGMIIADSWDSDIEFHLKVMKLLPLNVKLKFEENPEFEKIFKVESEENAIVFRCINFKDSTGTAYPIELATVKGKKILFYFRNYGEKNVIRKIEYTFYVEK